MRVVGKGIIQNQQMCVRVCSTAMFCSWFDWAWRSSNQAHIGQNSLTTLQQQRSRPKPRPPKFESEAGADGFSTRHLPSIGAEPGVAATLQTCGVRRTISPPQFDMLSLGARCQILLLLLIILLMALETGIDCSIPSFGRAYISPDVAKLLIPSQTPAGNGTLGTFGYVQRHEPHSCVVQETFEGHYCMSRE